MRDRCKVKNIKKRRRNGGLLWRWRKDEGKNEEKKRKEKDGRKCPRKENIASSQAHWYRKSTK
jgi:hypothetical protein